MIACVMLSQIERSIGNMHARVDYNKTGLESVRELWVAMVW